MPRHLIEVTESEYTSACGMDCTRYMTQLLKQPNCLSKTRFRE
jgi:hypothetical protein